MLTLTPDLLQQIEAHGRESYPYEGCGLLLGQSRPGHNWVVAIRPAANSWPVATEKRVRFAITPQEMLQAELAAMAEDLEIIGIFHSHPDDDPIASPRDLAWATWPGYSYLITEVRLSRPGLSRSWQLCDDRSGFTEEPVQLRENGEW